MHAYLFVHILGLIMILQEEQESIFSAVSEGDLTTLQNLHSSGIDVTSVVDVVSIANVDL